MQTSTVSGRSVSRSKPLSLSLLLCYHYHTHDFIISGRTTDGASGPFVSYNKETKQAKLVEYYATKVST